MRLRKIKPQGIISVALNHLKRVDIGRKVASALTDPRARKNREWRFRYLIEVLVYGMVSGSKNLRSVETFGEIYRERVPDTTLHDLITRIDPEPLRQVLVSEVKEALRAHELPKEAFPIRITAIDGKSMGTSGIRVGEFSQKLIGGGAGKYTNQALRAFHVSNETKLFIGQHELPHDSGEMREFPLFIDRLLNDYGKTSLLEVISVDAGMVSKKNADYLISKGLRYIMALKAPQRRLLKQAQKLLRSCPACAEQVESAKGCRISTKLFRASYHDSHWRHLREFWCVEKTITKSNGDKSSEARYFLSSINASKLSDSNVLAAVRMHWNIENNANWICDTTWEEDDAPWATRALTFVSHLLLIAYKIISRLVSRRSRDRAARAISWHELLRCVENACYKLADSLTGSLPIFEA